MMRKEGILIFLLVILVLSNMGFVSADQNLEISSSSLKVSLKAEDFETKSLSISSDAGGDFVLRVVSVPGVSLKENSFALIENERKDIAVFFNSSELEPGVYVGTIEIKSATETLHVPVIFEVESKSVFFDANLDIPPVYTEIEQGAKVVSQIKIFDLTSGGTQEGLGAVSIDLEYSVVDLSGNVLSVESEMLVVNRQTQLTKTIAFPKNIKTGNYVLSVLVKYKSSTGVASQTFSIVESKERSAIDFSDYSLLIIIIIALVFLLGIVIIFVYLIKERGNVLVELKKYNAQEMRNLRKILQEQGALLGKRKKGYKLMKEKDVQKEINKQIKRLKIRQERRVKEIRKLEKGGEIKKMKKKLREWKKRGYNTLPLEYKLKELSSEDMKLMMEKWKKKYSLRRKPKG